MTDLRFKRNASRMKRIMRDIVYHNIWKGRTGTYNSSGVLNADPTVGLDSTHIWVRPINSRAAVPALIGNIRGDLTDMPVRVGRNESGELVAFEQIIDEQSAMEYGARLPGLGAPTTPHEARNDPLAYRLLTGGRLLPATGGGLAVFVEAYLQVGFTASQDDYDVSSGVPAGTGESGWRKLYIENGALQAVDSAPSVYGLNVVDAQALAIPAGSTPLGAIGLTNGQTEIDWAYYVDLRIHHAPTPPAVLMAALHVDTTPVGNVSTGAQDLQTYTVPADTLAADGDRLHVRKVITFAISVSEELREYFGASILFDSGALTLAATAIGILDYVIIRTGAATQVYAGTFVSTAAGMTTSAFAGTASETLSGTIILKSTGDATVTNDVVEVSSTVDLVHAP